MGAVCGIGGGLFAVPLLHYGFKLPLRRAVATGLCLVCATAFASTTAELLHEESALLWEVVLPLIGGALVGAQFGFILSKYVNERALKGVFTILLFAIGLRMLLSMSVPAAAQEAEISFGLGVAAGIAGLGIMAGTLSPLLGIGGGLIVVPALLLTMPEIGGNGARAASLGIACVTSVRSIQLYMKERSVDLAVAPWIASGALTGAALGVQFAHMPGASALGQRVFGVILLVTAVRFGKDAFSGAVPAEDLAEIGTTDR